WGYDLLQGRLISKVLKRLRQVNPDTHVYPETEISSFLNRWGLDPVLERNRITDKADLKRQVLASSNLRVKEWAYTGGSYGEPLRIPLSKARSLYRTATFTYYNELGGYRLGDAFVLIRAKYKPALVQFLRNEHVFVPFDLSAHNLNLLI